MAKLFMIKVHIIMSSARDLEALKHGFHQSSVISNPYNHKWFVHYRLQSRLVEVSKKDLV